VLATRLTSAVSVSATPTWVTDSPTDRVRNSALAVSQVPRPTVLTSVERARVRDGPGSGSRRTPAP